MGSSEYAAERCTRIDLSAILRVWNVVCKYTILSLLLVLTCMLYQYCSVRQIAKSLSVYTSRIVIVDHLWLVPKMPE